MCLVPRGHQWSTTQPRQLLYSASGHPAGSDHHDGGIDDVAERGKSHVNRPMGQRTSLRPKRGLGADARAATQGFRKQPAQRGAGHPGRLRLTERRTYLSVDLHLPDHPGLHPGGDSEQVFYDGVTLAQLRGGMQFDTWLSRVFPQHGE